MGGRERSRGGMLVYIYILKKIGKKIFLQLNTIDTSLYFLTAEKMAVSLPTKRLSDPTSGSVLIGDYRLGPAHYFRECTSTSVSSQYTHVWNALCSRNVLHTSK